MPWQGLDVFGYVDVEQVGVALQAFTLVQIALGRVARAAGCLDQTVAHVMVAWKVVNILGSPWLGCLDDG